MKSRDELLADRCRHRVAGALGDGAVDAQLAVLPGWLRDGGGIARAFRFGNYHETIAFVNALAWMVHAEDHHPDLAVAYDRCTVRFATHSVGGVSDNDFICAAKTDAIYAQRTAAPSA